jgi:VIT1/CCC1 family predicted Fe2+/Mn2+ transporter
LSKKIDESTRHTLLAAQQNEITEHRIYSHLARTEKNTHNRQVLQQIADDELKHYQFWQTFTHETIEPNTIKVWFYVLIARIFGLTFGIKLMERGEVAAQVIYTRIAQTLPEAQSIVHDEDDHERALIALIDEERLHYIGSMVLGLNDALVELTGALAGFTLALQETSIITVTGLIMGLAASLSMGTSEYLSVKAEDSGKNPLKAALYTGVTYVFTVLLLISPYLVSPNVYLNLVLVITIALIVILVFSFYIAIAQDLSFKQRFGEMAFVSLGVTTLSFIIGYAVRSIFNIEI